MNGKDNGILLDAAAHIGGHLGYNKVVLEELGDIARRSRGLSDAAVAEYMQDASDMLRSAIQIGTFGPWF